MARKPSGAVVEHEARDGRTYRALRFTAYGKRRYVSLGAVTASDADRELRHVLADVERGTWQAPAAVEGPPEREPVPTFHQFAEQWFALRSPGWSESTRSGYRYELEVHLLPHFGETRIDRIDVAEVDAYRAGKLADGLSPAYVNKHLTRLGGVLDMALERDVINRNPMRVNTRNRRAKVIKKAPRYLDRAEQITALLDAAGELDRGAASHHKALNRRALLAVLVLGGLRISEALALRWRHVDLPAGRLRVDGTKTGAASRDVPMLPALRDELLAYRAGTGAPDADALVFATRHGKPVSRDNTRQRVMAKAVKRASERLVDAGHPPLPEGLTQHALRHTYISLRLALGHDLATVAQDAGHADVSVTYRVYLHVMRLDDESRDELRALVEGSEVAVIGSRAAQEPQSAGWHKAA